MCLVIAHNACIHFDDFCEARIWRIHTSLHFGNTFICIDQSAYRFLVIAHNAHVRHNIFCEAPCWRIRTSLNFANKFIFIHQSADTLLVIAHNARIHLNQISEASLTHTCELALVRINLQISINARVQIYL